MITTYLIRLHALLMKTIRLSLSRFLVVPRKSLRQQKIVQLKDANIISMTAFNTNELTTYATHALFCFADNHDTKKDDTKSRIGFFYAGGFTD